MNEKQRELWSLTQQVRNLAEECQQKGQEDLAADLLTIFIKYVEK